MGEGLSLHREFLSLLNKPENLYKFLKKIVFQLFSKKLLYRYEASFRKVYSLLYIGNKYECNVCKKKWRTFIYFNGEMKCPNCGSIGRDRMLYSLLHKALQQNTFLLDFSPSRCLYRLLKNKLPKNYYSTDFENEFIADYKFDITNIAIGNDVFDIICCFHILEHIQNDAMAMQELYRVLKPGGTIFV